MATNAKSVTDCENSKDFEKMREDFELSTVKNFQKALNHFIHSETHTPEELDASFAELIMTHNQIRTVSKADVPKIKQEWIEGEISTLRAKNASLQSEILKQRERDLEEARIDALEIVLKGLPSRETLSANIFKFQQQIARLECQMKVMKEYEAKILPAEGPLTSMINTIEEKLALSSHATSKDFMLPFPSSDNEEETAQGSTRADAIGRIENIRDEITLATECAGAIVGPLGKPLSPQSKEREDAVVDDAMMTG